MKKNLLKVTAIAFFTATSVCAMAEMQEAAKDSAKYEFKADTTVDKVTYTLENDWIYSANLNNYKAGDLANVNMARGMATNNGKLYFPLRGAVGEQKIIVVDGKTGKIEKTIDLDSKAFTKEETDSTGKVTTVNAVTLANNDIEFDDAGHCLVGPCATHTQPFQIYNVNLETGKTEIIIDEILSENKQLDSTINVRFDAFGVCGDIKTNGIIMAVNANALEVYKWTIVDGVASKAEQILLDKFHDGFTGTNPGSAPRVFPIDENMFYVDGNATMPTLYDMEGTLLDCFYHKVTDEEGKSFMAQYPSVANFNEGHNGLCDFEVVNTKGKTEYFLCLAARNTISHKEVPASTFAVLKYKDETRSFAETEQLFIFPENGFGSNSNAYRSALVSAEVTNNTADIYVYVGENGIAKYTFTNLSEEEGETAVENVLENNITVFVENNNIVLSETADVEVYSMTGQCVTRANGVSSLTLNQNGIFVVRAINAEGTSVQKVAIK